MAAQKRLDKQRVTFYMARTLKQTLAHVADETGLKQSYIIEQALTAWLAGRKQKKGGA